MYARSMCSWYVSTAAHVSICNVVYHLCMLNAINDKVLEGTKHITEKTQRPRERWENEVRPHNTSALNNKNTNTQLYSNFFPLTEKIKCNIQTESDV